MIEGARDHVRSRPETARRAVAALALALAVGLVVGLFVAYLLAYSRQIPSDAFTYLAAGERLNAGHDLYALSEGDRPVELRPPYWTVPLLSPPFIAVLWRPLAALAAGQVVYVWWLGSVAAIVGVVTAMAYRRPLATAVALTALAIPITHELGVGNVNGYLLLGSVLTWLLYRRDQDVASGALVAIMAAVKIYPATLGLWLMTQGRRGSIQGLVLGVVGTAVVSLVGAGFSAHLRYLEIARATSTLGASELSLAGLAEAGGVPSGMAVFLPVLALIVGAAVTIVTRRRPGISFAVAVVTMVAGSSVVNINTPSLLLAALAPFAWPLVDGTVVTPPSGPTDGTGPPRAPALVHHS